MEARTLDWRECVRRGKWQPRTAAVMRKRTHTNREWGRSCGTRSPSRRGKRTQEALWPVLRPVREEAMKLHQCKTWTSDSQCNDWKSDLKTYPKDKKNIWTGAQFIIFEENHKKAEIKHSKILIGTFLSANCIIVHLIIIKIPKITKKCPGVAVPVSHAWQKCPGVAAPVSHARQEECPGVPCQAGGLFICGFPGASGCAKAWHKSCTLLFSLRVPCDTPSLRSISSASFNKFYSCPVSCDLLRRPASHVLLL